MDSEEEELCLIDAGIESMLNLPIHYRLTVINLHANQIKSIENLRAAPNLHHLDLSSNAITRITGLESLLNLRTINLSCNRIRQVEGFDKLTSLVKCNLSYNQIVNTDGFMKMRGESYRLTHVELHGNMLDSVTKVIHCLAGCMNLRSLVLACGNSANPLCERYAYERDIFGALPRLQSLNGRDSAGHDVIEDDILADIPGLEQFADFLISSTSTLTDGRGPIVSATPRIDAMLNAFRRQAVVTPGQSSSTSDHNVSSEARMDDGTKDLTIDSTTEHPNARQEPSSAYEQRINNLEHQISKLLQHRGKSEVGGESSQKNSKTDGCNAKIKTSTESCRSTSDDTRAGRHAVKRDVDETEESDDERASLDKETVEKLPVATEKRGRYCTVNSRPRRSHAVRASRSPHMSKPTNTSASGANKLTGDRDDRTRRDDLQMTYVQILQQLESERERRWKAEQAVKKLAERFQQEVSKAREEQETGRTTAEVVARLKESLSSERELRLKLQAEKEQIELRFEDLAQKLDSEIAASSELRKVVRANEETSNRMEQEHMKQESILARKTQEAQLKAAALTREVELVKAQAAGFKSQQQQMQELLMKREQEHQRDLEGRFAVGSREFQDLLTKELAKQEKDYQRERRKQHDEVDSLTKKYQELEDEFRLALHSEADRFKQLQASYETVSTENARNEQALVLMQQKDGKSAAMIAELTSVAKEQKVRIAELAKSKQEQMNDLKERVQQLELHLEEARRRMVTLEMLKQEKVKLTAQITAQESLIEGLKAEKRLWGEELAKQSSSLAQDRGRIEAKIETLQAELGSAKCQLEHETDVVRIKTKIIEDQNETVRKLKEGLAERDAQIKETREESIANQRMLEEQLAAEMEENHKVMEQLEREKVRKEELKDEIVSLRRDVDEVNKKNNLLNNRLKVYATLESQVQQMKSTWETSEHKLTAERDAAIEASASAADKLRTMDDAFRKQLDAKEDAHKRELQELAAVKDSEITAASVRVQEVENEMRVLLRETETAKRNTEERIRKLTHAFSELQRDIL